MKSYLFCYGPIAIKPGQNTIDFNATDLVPSKPGYITRWDPDLIYTDKTKGTKGVPSVDVLHLHHAVWIKNSDFSNPQWAAGEEKTIVQQPRGFGWKSLPTDRYLLTFMIHNLFPTTDHVYLTWKVDFVPDTSSAAASIKPVKTLWLDVAGLNAYPVFDALRKWGVNGKYTFPDDVARAGAAEEAKVGSKREFTFAKDQTLIATAAHLHPGGLSASMFLDRGGDTRKLFTSNYKYWEPAGAVSWDAAAYGTKPTWRVKVKAGDKIRINATYDTSKASWYEVMGIMPVTVYDGSDVGGVDPYVTLPTQTGTLTHGHLPENNNHGGTTVTLNNAVNLLAAPVAGGSTVGIDNLVYDQGDLSSTGAAAKPPTIKAGETLTFSNNDSTGDPRTDFIFHTITACANPCNKDTGIAYPRADAPVEFDSGELGYGPAGSTPTAGRKTWTTPSDLPAGTYAYFCRVHPYMRGAFRVVS
jgi:plastocyanin